MASIMLTKSASSGAVLPAASQEAGRGETVQPREIARLAQKEAQGHLMLILS